MSAIRREVKDSVFTCLFSEPKYARELYLVLHPEDTDVTEDDIQVVTIENVLTIGQYNDLGLQVRGRLIMLSEAQSTFSPNVPLRLLLYLAQTYKDYAVEQKLYLYGGKAVSIPKPELYMVYTGTKKDVPELLRLSDLYGGGSGSVEVTVRVFRRTGTLDIVDQYVRFCEIADEERKTEGGKDEALRRIVERCRAEGILVEFLQKREKEVLDIMSTLFDYDWILMTHDNAVKEESYAEGRAEGEAKERLSSLKKMMKNLGLSAQDAVRALDLPPEEQARYIALL